MSTNNKLKPFLTKNSYITLSTSQENAEKEAQKFEEDYNNWLLQESIEKTESSQISILMKNEETNKLEELF